MCIAAGFCNSVVVSCSHPPPPPDAEDGVAGEFKCFQCANSACPLSGRIPGGEVPILPCDLAALLPSSSTSSTRGKCPSGGIIVKKSDTGYSLTCSAYPKCGNSYSRKWLPRLIKSGISRALLYTACRLA